MISLKIGDNEIELKDFDLSFSFSLTDLIDFKIMAQGHFTTD